MSLSDPVLSEEIHDVVSNFYGNKSSGSNELNLILQEVMAALEGVMFEQFFLHVNFLRSFSSYCITLIPEVDYPFN